MVRRNERTLAVNNSRAERGLKLVSVLFPDELYAAVVIVAKENHLSLADVIRLTLKRHLSEFDGGSLMVMASDNKVEADLPIRRGRGRPRLMNQRYCP